MKVVEGKAIDACLLVVSEAVGVFAEVVDKLEGRVALSTAIVEGNEPLTPQAFTPVELKDIA